MSIASSLIFCMTEKTGVNFGKVGRCSRTSSALLPLAFLFLVKKFWIIFLIAFSLWGWRISAASRVTSYNMTNDSSAALHLKMTVSDDYFDYITLRAVRDTDECTKHKLCALLPQQLSLRTLFLRQAFSKLQHRSTNASMVACKLSFILKDFSAIFCT